MNLDGIIKKLDKLNQVKERELAEEKFSKLSKYGVLEVIIISLKEIKRKFPDLCNLSIETTFGDLNMPEMYKKGTLTVKTKDTQISIVAEINNNDIQVAVSKFGKIETLFLSKSHNYWVNKIDIAQEFKTKEELQDAVISFIESKI